MAKPPPAVEGANYCPLIKQGCIGDACTFWIKMYGVDDDGQQNLDEECAINWGVLLQRETLIETARVAAGHDKVASETQNLGKVIAVGIESTRRAG